MHHVLNDYRRRNRPLTRYLTKLFTDSALAARFERIRSLEELDDFEGAVQQGISDLRPQSPSLGGTRVASTKDDGYFRPIGNGQSVGVAHFYVAVQVHGNPELVEYWPDANPDVEPVDAKALAVAAKGGLDETLRHRLQLISDTWQLGVPDIPSEEWGLYTFVDLTPEEEKEVANNEFDIRAIIEERIAKARPIVEAIAAQTDHYFEVELPQRLQNMIAHKRERLTNRAAVRASLTFDNEWKLPAPRLESVATDTKTTLPEVTSGGFRVAHRDRLDPASFSDVQRVIWMWASGVERYPAAFNLLGEDRLSDLLAVTLNASLANAKREVYSRGGKSDIYIQADMLAEGRGTEKVFICEAKIASDDTVVTDAVDQLFGYLNTHDTAAVLLLYFKQQDFDSARTRRLAALRRIIGFAKEEPGPSGWPIYDFEIDGRYVRVCVASVHLPPPKKK
ncbi:hypothetical protein [Nocardia arizonensis]|uniref:hypothetical protein n=1 Tax=Nocardia arizonensis TaxID=1141647 RepID=UPI000A40D569|nr:hypothetical protein [Nocardia arizonensis]